MSRVERNWHQNFLEYTRRIAEHENYEGMPDPYKDDGSVRWVVVGKSETGQARKAWWDSKREELGIQKQRFWRSKTARANHPTGRKPCQICGRILSVHYVYPNRRTIKKLNSTFDLESDIEHDDFMEMPEIVEMIIDELGIDIALNRLRRVFGVPSERTKDFESYSDYILENCKSRLSPGAMSNCPDRFDGFHTYNACCRKTHDTGRHADNLARYGEDRRVYENWSDGDWKASAWLMRRINQAGKKGVCAICGKKGKVTADHLGPISLGFSVGDPPILRPACRACNSARNNRLSLRDIREIKELEQSGRDIASWHTKAVWDTLKDKPTNDEEAKILSRMMRTNLHYVLTMLGQIAKAGYEAFLADNFLNPEYANYSISFEGFDPETGEYEQVVKTRKEIRQYSRNAERYIRKSLSALRRYVAKKNRKFPKKRYHEIEELSEEIIAHLEVGNSDAALEVIERALFQMAIWAEEAYDARTRNLD